jgi:ribonuclease BN (tRNA processing enzyme)
MEKFWNIWNANGEIKIGNYTLQGFSIAAYRTNFYIKELSIMFDAGISSPFHPSYIFVTHAHTDHIANIPFHLINPDRNKECTVYCPLISKDHIEQYVKCLRIASEGKDNWPNDRSYNMIGVKTGDYFNIMTKNKRYKIEVIKCYHSLDCYGYGFVETKRKLKKELLHLSGKELKDMSDNDKYDYFENYDFCYIGDTSKEILNDGVIKRYNHIIIECTFLYDTETKRADLTKHIHWNDLKPFVEINSDKMFYLYHFSKRYRPKEIVEFFKKQNMKNVVVLANEKTNEQTTENNEVVDEDNE